MTLLRGITDSIPSSAKPILDLASPRTAAYSPSGHVMATAAVVGTLLFFVSPFPLREGGNRVPPCLQPLSLGEPVRSAVQRPPNHPVSYPVQGVPSQHPRPSVC